MIVGCDSGERHLVPDYIYYFLLFFFLSKQATLGGMSLSLVSRRPWKRHRGHYAEAEWIRAFDELETEHTFVKCLYHAAHHELHIKTIVSSSSTKIVPKLWNKLSL